MNARMVYLPFVLFLELGTHPSSWAARLGDLPDEPSKSEGAKKQQSDEDLYTPEERKLLVNELIDKYYQDGVTALYRDSLTEAKTYFEKVLALSRHHARAKEKLVLINKRLSPKKTSLNPAPTRPKAEIQPKPAAKPEVQKNVPAEDTPKKVGIDEEGSDELYFRALTASQHKDWPKALTLCKEALELNPNNLQAQRMSDRLSR